MARGTRRRRPGEAARARANARKSLAVAGAGRREPMPENMAAKNYYDEALRAKNDYE
jgi:hypothetical protein